MLTDDDIAKLIEVFATRHELNEALLEQDARWNQKHQAVLNKVDAVYKEVIATRQEFFGHRQEHDDINFRLDRLGSKVDISG